MAAPGVARADGLEGPPLVAWYPRYNAGIPNIAIHGSLCLNREAQMPADRRAHCDPPALSELGPGHYAISVGNAAPFPVIDNDSGFAVSLTAVGSNAHCFEESTGATGTTFESVIRCVEPGTGADVDADFSWSYRADSLDYPQDGKHVPNHAYARVGPDGTVVPEESFHPLDLHDDDTEIVRTSEGRYTVTFRDLNPLDASLEPAVAPHNVIVQKTCIDDVANGAAPDGCFRAVCVPYGWTPGDFETPDTVIDVRCVDSEGSPRDTGFRVWFGDWGWNSQGSWDGGYRYGWVDWELSTEENACFESPDDFPANSQHETPPSFFPGMAVEACRVDVGTYDVNFHPYISFYSADGPNLALSSREVDGSYCTVGSVLCDQANGACGIPDSTPNPRVTVTCFDASGEPFDSSFNLNVTY